MSFKITGIDPAMRKLRKLQVGFPSILEDSMTTMFDDIVSQAMENLRNRIKGTTFSRGDEPTHVSMKDNLDLWEYEKIGVSAGYYQWKVWNRSDHAAPVEFGSRSPIRPHGEWLHLGNNVLKREVKGQEPKHFFGDALYYEKDRWISNLSRYMKKNINSILR